MREEIRERFRVAIQPLSEGEHWLEYSLEPVSIGLEPETFSNIEVDVRLDVHQSRIFVMFEARATAHLECDRTLMPFDQAVSGDYSVLFTSGALEGMEDEDDEVRLFVQGDTELDISDAVRDTLLLAIPVRKVAPEALDIEIQTSFGTSIEEDEIDPRWETLKKLKSSKN